MLTALIGPVSNLLGKFIEDKDMKNKLAHEVATMAESHAPTLPISFSIFRQASLAPPWLGPQRQATPAATAAYG